MLEWCANSRKICSIIIVFGVVLVFDGIIKKAQAACVNTGLEVIASYKTDALR